MSSFKLLATVTASTKRRGAVIDGLEPAYATEIESLKCLPLDPVDPAVAQGVEGLGFRELLQTSIEGSPDIIEGDLLVVGSVEYPVKSVENWTWSPDGTDYLVLLLEDLK